MDHYDTNSILIDEQHGFRPNRSCESQLISTTQDIAEAIDCKGEVDAVLLDFSKAFDRVPHCRLLNKLEYYGIRGPLIKWINKFLTTRLQRVIIDGKCSDWERVQSGVPQGTVLGPLLFLTFINDITQGITSKIKLFADDCLLYRTIKDESDSQALQQDLDCLHQWSQVWQMQFNTDKCHTMKFTLKQKPHEPKYFLGESELSTVTEHPYLGVTLSNKLSWNNHINKITSRANRILGLINRNLRGSSKKIKERAYQSLVRPHLEYCSSVWNPYSKTQKDKIEAVQRRAARFVLHRYDRYDSVTQMMNELQWQNLENRRKTSCLLLLCKTKLNLVAIPANGILLPMPVSITRSHPLKFKLIPTRILIYRHSFFPQTIFWWNALPHDILSSSTTLDSFKAALTH